MDGKPTGRSGNERLALCCDIDDVIVHLCEIDANYGYDQFDFGDSAEMKPEITQEDFGTLCICAIRYCQGRQTYMPSLVREIVTPHLKELSDRDINVMVEDCGYQRRMHLYGDERIDLPGWLEWEQLLLAEQKKRKEK